MIVILGDRDRGGLARLRQDRSGASASTTDWSTPPRRQTERRGRRMPPAGSSTEQQCLPPVLVQTVEERPGHGEHLVVVAHHRQSPAQHVETGSFRCVEALVGGVRLVHDTGHVPEHGASVISKRCRMVSKLQSPAGCDSSTPGMSNTVASSGTSSGSSTKYELCVLVEESSDEPRAPRSIDVTARTGRPSHGCATGVGCGRRSPRVRLPLVARSHARGAGRSHACGSSELTPESPRAGARVPSSRSRGLARRH